MKRQLYPALIKWKHDPKRKPLLLQGARQVGKTYLIKEFGTNEYGNCIYLNFEQDPGLSSLFNHQLNPIKIIENIGFYIGRKISSDNTLIFFDEIQTTPEVLTSLKYFYEQAPEYHIIGAGSLLGVSIGRQSGFPVGKVNFLTMYPMNFFEYLIAVDEELIVNELLQKDPTVPFPDIIHDKLLAHLKLFLYLGGMPEVLQDYIDNRNIESSRIIQKDIIKAYERDFSKYTDKLQAIKTSELWNSIPSQLARENKKFKYNEIRKNARSVMYEQTIEWLKKAGIINLVYQISTPKIPLSGYADYTKFKLYLLDTGLLGAMLNITSNMIIEPDTLFQEYNGAFIENFVASELVSAGYENLFYWVSNSDAEVDFVVQNSDRIYPVEVKSGYSRNKKSLIVYKTKYNPDFHFRLSPRNFIKDGQFINLPLYAGFLMNKF